ncbi:hypothetical protein [Aquariibacter albus]|uniref:Uncharacterized protein n=1 Tax=Aquariibacter albus TaxID=2759899 RepID=A0A839HKD4_9BURK|nr:hypothetical protein [Aquariibacter albus]MBB1161502.1 hypothetical protein [Aquariibacter albus]
MQITLNTKPLVALLHLAAKGDIRTYLNTVHVEASAREHFLVASNGQIIGAMRQEQGIEEGPEAFTVQVPRAVVEALRKAGPSIHLHSPNGLAWTATDTLTGSSHRWHADGLHYPDWRRAIPVRANGETAQFNPENLLAMHKFSAAKGAKTTNNESAFLIAHNGEDGALVQVRGVPEFVGLLMPWRRAFVEKHLRMEPPSWVRALAATEADCDLA